MSEQVDLSPDELLIQGTCAVLIDGQVCGTAWLVSDQGHLLTAGHVLGSTRLEREQVEVRFADDIARFKFRTIEHEQIIDGAHFYVLENMHSKRQSFVYFKDSGITECIVRMHDYIIERSALGCSLELDAVNEHVGQTTRFRSNQHRE